MEAGNAALRAAGKQPLGITESVRKEYEDKVSLAKVMAHQEAEQKKADDRKEHAREELKNDRKGGLDKIMQEQSRRKVPIGMTKSSIASIARSGYAHDGLRMTTFNHYHDGKAGVLNNQFTTSCDIEMVRDFIH